MVTKPRTRWRRSPFTRWIKEQKLDVRGAARRLGIAEKSVYSYATGRRRPAPEVAAKIEKRTGIPSSAWRRLGRVM